MPMPYHTNPWLVVNLTRSAGNEPSLVRAGWGLPRAARLAQTKPVGAAYTAFRLQFAYSCEAGAGVKA